LAWAILEAFCGRAFELCNLDGFCTFGLEFCDLNVLVELCGRFFDLEKCGTEKCALVELFGVELMDFCTLVELVDFCKFVVMSEGLWETDELTFGWECTGVAVRGAGLVAGLGQRGRVKSWLGFENLDLFGAVVVLECFGAKTCFDMMVVTVFWILRGCCGLRHAKAAWLKKYMII
jgi:hypothetical protein